MEDPGSTTFPDLETPCSAWAPPSLLPGGSPHPGSVGGRQLRLIAESLCGGLGTRPVAWGASRVPLSVWAEPGQPRTSETPHWSNRGSEPGPRAFIRTRAPFPELMSGKLPLPPPGLWGALVGTSTPTGRHLDPPPSPCHLLLRHPACASTSCTRLLPRCPGPAEVGHWVLRFPPPPAPGHHNSAGLG